MLTAVVDLTTWKMQFGFPEQADSIVLRITGGRCGWYLESKNGAGELRRLFADWPPRKAEVVLLLLKILSELGWEKERADLLNSGWLEFLEPKDRYGVQVAARNSQGRILLTLYLNGFGDWAISSRNETVHGCVWHSGVHRKLSKEGKVKLILRAVEEAANYFSYEVYIAILAALGVLPEKGQEENWSRKWVNYIVGDGYKPRKKFSFPPQVPKEDW